MNAFIKSTKPVIKSSNTPNYTLRDRIRDVRGVVEAKFGICVKFQGRLCDGRDQLLFKNGL